ncbi:hypothetical protein GF376_03140 [Candidatus Peregrinibacteria bacterium]|nr:hypothetical protein [Candidatus Peregrinibacteria bacterium]
MELPVPAELVAQLAALPVPAEQPVAKAVAVAPVVMVAWLDLEEMALPVAQQAAQVELPVPAEQPVAKATEALPVATEEWPDQVEQVELQGSALATQSHSTSPAVA